MGNVRTEMSVRLSRIGASAVRRIIRGHGATYFGIGPDGAADRSRWLVYDSAQREINRVPAVADLGPSAREPALAGRWAGIDRWKRYFERGGRPSRSSTVPAPDPSGSARWSP